MSIKLCLDFGNDEHIILCNFGGRIMSDFEVVEERFWSPPPRSQETENAQSE